MRLKRKFQEKTFSPFSSVKIGDTIVGIDETGRGSLAGPLYMGYFCYKYDTNSFPISTYTIDQGKDLSKELYNFYRQIDDSKKIKTSSRNLIYQELDRLSLLNNFQKKSNHGVIFVSNKTIDEYGLASCLQHIILVIAWLNIIYFHDSNIIILCDGGLKLPNEINFKLIDEILKQNNITIFDKKNIDFLKNITLKFFSIKKGDEKIFAISLASIIAKVTRDFFMIKIDKLYPSFGWKNNKGYGSKKHIETIRKVNKQNEFLRQTFLLNI
jgi:ribonuclease HII